MGWSCSAAASRVMEVWTEACIAATDSQNTWKVNGIEYFWERSNTEHSDGAITGQIHKVDTAGFCHSAGSFKIEGDGTITRVPKFLKDAWDNRDKRKYP
jgi:hypothetical protein